MEPNSIPQCWGWVISLYGSLIWEAGDTGRILIITGPWFNIKMSSYQYRKSHYGDKTIVRSSYLHNGISYTGKMTSLYWIRAKRSSYLHNGISYTGKMTSLYWIRAQGIFSQKTSHSPHGQGMVLLHLSLSCFEWTFSLKCNPEIPYIDGLKQEIIHC